MTTPGSVADYYTRNSRLFALLMRPFAALRRRAIARLALQPGEVVLELGCGTGTSFAALLSAIGAQSHLIGVDASAAMLAVAQTQAVRHRWSNLSLLWADAAQAVLAARSVDRVLCFYANDIMTSPEAVAQAVRSLRPGGRFVAAGVKLAQGPGAPLVDALTRSYAHSGCARPNACCCCSSDCSRRRNSASV